MHTLNANDFELLKSCDEPITFDLKQLNQKIFGINLLANLKSNLVVNANSSQNIINLNLAKNHVTTCLLNATQPLKLSLDLQPGAKLKLISFLNLNLSSNNLITAKIRENAICEQTIAIINNEQKEVNLDVVLNHLKSKSKSDAQVFAVALDRSKTITSIYSNVPKNAFECDVNQAIKNIILNRKASASGRPVLKIKNNDIIAHHGCAIGQVHPLQLYYMMSRGLSHGQALKMLINSFLKVMIDQIPWEYYKEQLLNDTSALLRDEKNYE